MYLIMLNIIPEVDAQYYAQQYILTICDTSLSIA